MENYVIQTILIPELNRFVEHLCVQYNKPITTYHALCSNDPNKLRILAEFPKLHKEEDFTNIVEELTYDTSLSIPVDPVLS